MSEVPLYRILGCFQQRSVDIFQRMHTVPHTEGLSGIIVHAGTTPHVRALQGYFAYKKLPPPIGPP